MERIRTWEEGHFRLTLYDTHKTAGDGKSVLAYRLSHYNELVFEGADFRCSPLHAIDSDATVATILSFLSLRPGDTDGDYFDSYSDEQLRWAQTYGEELSMYAYELEEAAHAD